MMYGELRFFHRYERLPDTLQRLDFILFDLIPTLGLPFYLAYVVLVFGAADAALLLGCIYILLLGISIFNMALAFVLFNRFVGLSGLVAAPIFPSTRASTSNVPASSPTLPGNHPSAASRKDDFVPPRVRRALFGDLAR